MVSTTYIENCFRHARFVSSLNIMDDKTEEKDNIPLSVLMEDLENRGHAIEEEAVYGLTDEFLTRRQTLELPGSTVSLTTLEDVDDNSTAITEGPAVSELHNEETRQIYSTYFNEAANYDPDLPITSYLEQVKNILLSFFSGFKFP
nr:uncharacterized protein LOC107446389 [Parasteatoda tepidariorum]